MMQKVKSSSALFIELSQPPYLNDAEYTYQYITWYMQAAPTPEDIQKFNSEWDSKTFMNTVKKIDENSQFEWRNALENANFKVPPGMRKAPGEIARKFATRLQRNQKKET